MSPTLMSNLSSELSSKLSSELSSQFPFKLSSKLSWGASVTTLSVFCFFMSSAAEAASKKAPSSGSSGSCGTTTPAYSTPSPVRYAYVRPVGTKAFTMNGNSINLSADLQNMVNSIVTQYSNIEPTSTTSDDCGYHLEFEADVLDLELNVITAGVTVGYSPAGSGSITNISGSATVNGGSVEMGFSVYRCSNPVSGSSAPETCNMVVSSTATHITAGVHLNFTANFSQITTSANFLYNTPLGNALQTIMVNGIKQLVASSKFSMLPWQALVMEYDPNTGLFTFDAGTQSGIATNQSFMVYSPVSAVSTGVCAVSSPVAYAHTIAADTVTSTAQVDTTLNGTIQAGDIVMLRAVSSQ